ncbi:MAG: hypothetical protein QOI01_2699 [Mycobacterium sp.]|jgi:hypothetical protein|nr:hypothetical protein [Mycobacterium sp.]MDT7754631.1 hypothetical protein [Mycobacterium sp.]
MIPHRDEASYLRAVALAVLVASSVVALRGHIAAGTLNPVAGAIGGAALSIVVAVLGIALFVVARPIVARIGDRCGLPPQTPQLVRNGPLRRILGQSPGQR